MTTILLVEDEPHIAAFVSRGLESAGYTTVVVDDGAEGLARALAGDIDLVLLDVGLPTIDGFEVLRQLRSRGLVRAGHHAHRALEHARHRRGPGCRSQRLRVEAVHVRRTAGARALPAAREQRLQPGSRSRYGDVALDILARRATVDGREVELSAREFALAEQFLRSPGRVLTREQLLSRVWGLDFDPGSNVVDVYVRYLRGKLGGHHIVTVRGAGYRWE